MYQHVKLLKAPKQNNNCHHSLPSKMGKTFIPRSRDSLLLSYKIFAEETMFCGKHCISTAVLNACTEPKARKKKTLYIYFKITF